MLYYIKEKTQQMLYINISVMRVPITMLSSFFYYSKIVKKIKEFGSPD